MRNILKNCGLMGTMLMFVFSSCQKDETKAVAELKSPAILKASSTNLVLTRADADKVAVTFEFAEPDYGYKAAPKHVLQLALEGTAFAAPIDVALEAQKPIKSFTVLDFNALMLRLNLPLTADSKIQARIKSNISENAGLAYSNVVNITVWPFALSSFIYVPGAYQNWTPATAESLISQTSNGIYVGIINFTTGNLNFKIVTKRSWGPPEYGKGATDGTIAIGGGDIAAPKIGSQRLTVNMNAGTIVFDDYSFGIVGSATAGGWDTDTDMSYDNATQTWSATLTLSAGVIKFRLNDAWAVSYGGSNNVLNQANDNNIPITEAGNYKVSFSIPNMSYSVVKL